MYTFYSHYNTDWLAYTEIDLDPNNSVTKRLRCIYLASMYVKAGLCMTVLETHRLARSDTHILCNFVLGAGWSPSEPV